MCLKKSRRIYFIDQNKSRKKRERERASERERITCKVATSNPTAILLIHHGYICTYQRELYRFTRKQTKKKDNKKNVRMNSSRLHQSTMGQ